MEEISDSDQGVGVIRDGLPDQSTDQFACLDRLSCEETFDYEGGKPLMWTPEIIRGQKKTLIEQPLDRGVDLGQIEAFLREE